MLISYCFNDVLIGINRIPDILKNNGEIVQNVATRTIKYAGSGNIVIPVIIFPGWIMGVVILLNIMIERVVACWFYRKYDEVPFRCFVYHLRE